jgi:hypothetical protein
MYLSFVNENCDYTERRIIIVTTPSDIVKIENQILLNDNLNAAQYGYPYIYKRLFLDKSDTIKYYDFNLAKSFFKFQPNHPIINTAYGIYDIFPNDYIPLNNFHEYYKNIKHNAFIELCANLGAKEIYLRSIEINSENIKQNNNHINKELLNLGIKLNNNSNKESDCILKFSFPEENKDIKEYSTPWLDIEPAWGNICNLRIKNHLKNCEAEFNYSDDMGINLELARKMNGINISFGGDFKRMEKIKLNYKIEFW